jgi:integrase
MKKVSGKANHSLYKRGETFWVRYSKGGRTLQKSLDTENVMEARLKRDVEVAAFMNSKEPNWKGKKLCAEYFDQWLETKKQKAETTQTSMRIQWEKHLKPYFGHMAVEDITETLWMRYVDEKRKEKPNRKFFNDRKYFSMFFNWCFREGFIDRRPHLPDVDGELEGGHAYSDDEIQRLMEAAPTANLKLQIQMALTMGMRKWEILNLEWSQIDFIKGTIYLPAHKTKIRKARTFPISQATLTELHSRAQNSSSPFVFPNPRDPSKSVGRDGNASAWETCKAGAGIKGKFHWLRHTFLTRAFKTNTPPALICAFAGLSMDVAQRTYLHFNHEDMKAISGLNLY